ncbi:hypothetical protein [Providencia manganoxydans]|uniref:hypothetical protein n=1 Tax=Providencia manganoxydans TaxID=2923283 RepID=UPI0034E438D6
MSRKPTKLRNELGSYLLGYFRLKVNTDKADYSNLTQDEECTLIHEYVHFLQNITTTYGLFLLGCVARTNHVLTWVKQNSQDYAVVNEKNSVLRKNTDFLEQENQLSDLLYHTLGSDGSSSNESELNENTLFYKVEEIECGRFYNYEDEIFSPLVDNQKIIVIYSHNFNKDLKIKVELGAICLMETMAVIIEKHIGNRSGSNNNPKSPYLIAKDVANFLLKTDVSDNIICIVCELALQSRTPGEEFYNILTIIESYFKDEIISLSNDYCNLKDKLFKIANKYSYSITVGNDYLSDLNKLELKNYIISKVKEDFEFFFNGDLGLGFKLTELVEYIINNFNKDDNLLFISDLLNGNAGDKRKIIEVMKERGMPLLFTNTAFVGHFFPEENNEFDSQFFYLSVLNDYLNIIKGIGTSCEHYFACKSFNNGCVNDSCINNPRDKANEKKLCPLGVYFKVFGT